MNSAFFVRITALLPLLVLLVGPIDETYGYTFSVLHTFQGGKDGYGPSGSLLLDKVGNLYGATGGGHCGTAFKLTPNGKKTMLHIFHPRVDGCGPSSLINDKSGNFYGTTGYGGTSNDGTVFELTQNGAETVLHSFNGMDGRDPSGGVVEDNAGNLYGTNEYEGNDSCSIGCGLIFKITPDGTETSFYTFQGGSDGANPTGDLIKDGAGNIYGTTFFGGGGTACHWQPPSGCGTVFKLTPDGTETVLYAFSGGSDGANPAAGLALDNAGNLYGTTFLGGADGGGTVFELTPAGVESVLHSFAGGTDGEEPDADLLFDHLGDLYGTTPLGGGGGNHCGNIGCGIVFRLAPNGTETILHAFTDGSDGALPVGRLTVDKAGNLYGAAAVGGETGCDGQEGCGTVFQLSR